MDSGSALVGGACRRTVLAMGLSACANGLVDEPPQNETGLARVAGLDVGYVRRRGLRPTVVFESGLGDGAAVWSEVIARLDSSVAYLAYDRPGYGRSAAPPPARERVAGDARLLFEGLLARLAMRGPLVLVGHSLGGLYITEFAAHHRNRVVGMVFVDARPATFRVACDEAGIGFCGSNANRPTPENWPAHIVAELTGIRATEDNAPALAPLRDIPVTVLASDAVWQGEQGGEGFEVWQAQQRLLAESFQDHRFARISGASHYIQRDKPDAVASAINDMVRIVRQHH